MVEAMICKNCGTESKHLIIIGASVLVVVGVVVALILILGGNSYESGEDFGVSGEMIPDDVLNDGPDDNGDADNGNEPTGNHPKGWPTYELPPGFPVYPGGQPEYILDDDGFFLTIYYTDRNSFEGYVDDLKAWGFEFDEPGSDGIYTGFAETWKITILFNENQDCTTFLLSENNPALRRIAGWPPDGLPSGFPVYPGGQPEHNFDGAFVAISIFDTDKNTFEGYMDDLRAWGFEFGEPEPDGSYEGYAEKCMLIIGFYDGPGITTIVFSEYDSASAFTAGWPADKLPPDFPVYPGGQLKYFLEGATVFISVDNTDKSTFEGYMDNLKAWGFEFSGQQSNGSYEGFTESWKLTIVFDKNIKHTAIVLSPD